MSVNKDTQTLTAEERRVLLDLARRAVAAAASNTNPPGPPESHLFSTLIKPGACFVTLTDRRTGDLRGCTGILVAQRPLAEEVIRTAGQTALRDPRFLPVQPHEVDDISIEISVLTPPTPLSFSDPAELPILLRVGIDGVTLHRQLNRATFLPQVWHKIPDPEKFLDRLCIKMGLLPGEWRKPGMTVEVYQVEEFSDKDTKEAP